MVLLSFSCLKSYYYLLVYWLLDISIVAVRDYFYLYEDITDPEFLKGIEFVYISLLNISDLFAGFLVLFTHCKLKKKNIKEIEMEVEDEEKQNKEKLKKKKTKNAPKIHNKENKDGTTKKPIELIYNDNSIRNHEFLYLFLISLIEFIARSIDILYMLIFQGRIPIRPGETNWLISVDTFSRIILSHFILKSKIYNHHIFSIILILIGLFSMSVCAFQSIIEEELNNWPYFLFVVAKNILLPLEDVINKILLTDKFLLPHYLMFYRGIYNFFMVIILGLSTIIPGKVQFEYFSKRFKDQKKKIFLKFH